ncbi:TetR/AcrR family transcriptional regulator [Nocardia sp. NPDC050175]|uniref:TetR/AcrR family transcriptional regulator n=1 Tax=Nocardia sp. NPDC050175 TaxID=3364317 RepID=UPI00379EE12A
MDPLSPGNPVGCSPVGRPSVEIIFYGSLASVGHREDLLEGAKRCLIEKGYARTSARDIVAASGTNLASIGYHYGSKEALLSVALIEATREWGDEVAAALSSSAVDKAAPLEQFQNFWDEVITRFSAHRALWAVTFEVFTQIDRVDDLRARLSDAMEEARQGLGGFWAGAPDEETSRALGSLLQALLTGVITQWLVDPQRAPTGRDLTLALRSIVRIVAEDPTTRPAEVD